MESPYRFVLAKKKEEQSGKMLQRKMEDKYAFSGPPSYDQNSIGVGLAIVEMQCSESMRGNLESLWTAMGPCGYHVISHTYSSLIRGVWVKLLFDAFGYT